ncbi:hypothetical protein NVS78_00585 [Gabonibacter sp. KD22]|nr:hypothetical protein [Gabonibacter chumensis]MCR9010757.1 hypothetical protein [Gabonibacter chumensis]
MSGVELPSEGFKLLECRTGFRQASGTEVAAHEDTPGGVGGSVTGMDQDAGTVGNIREIDF